jgi:hypothetical protein
LRELVWNSLLTAQMNACYWNSLALRYNDREKWLKIFLAVTASSTVAGWTIWAHYDFLWKTLSGLSAIVAVALPILDYSGQVEKMTKLASKCAQLRVGYELLWAQFDSLSPQSILDAQGKLAQQEIELSDVQAALPDDRKLLEQCQNEVLKSRGYETV